MKVLILKTVEPNMTAYGGFVWPSEGPVEAPDWHDDDRCGGGLHGALWGEGDGTLFNWDPDAKWLVVEVEKDDIRDLDGKVKFPRGSVVFCGNQYEATTYLAERAPGRAIIGATTTAGFQGTATAGFRGTATAGKYGVAITGEEGTATAGVRGTATVCDLGSATAGNYGTATAGGYHGTATAGNYGTATAGYYGTATAGTRGSATAGDRGTATTGVYGTATAGEYGEIRIRWHDSHRYRLAVGYVGEDGIEPNTPYRCDDNGNFVKAPRESQ